MNAKQIKEMMDVQDELNCQLNPDWEKAGWDFSLAADVEMVEAIEHYGWKWWKHQECDINQVKMELVDIWHFILSQVIELRYNIDEVLRHLEVGFDFDQCDFLQDALNFQQGLSVKYKLIYLARCCKSINMNFAELRSLYLGKAILNKFRWRNGYNDGTYIKVWDGLEDNEYLTSILMCHPDAHADEIYQVLEEHYRKIV